MSKYSPEERARILEAALAAIAEADRVLDKPRPPLAEVPVEDKLAKWKREAREQEQRFARERAEGWPLTEYERAERAAEQVNALVDQQKRFILDVVANVVAHERAKFEQKIAALSAEIGQLRADRTIDRALAKGEPGGEVIDLPALTLRKRA